MSFLQKSRFALKSIHSRVFASSHRLVKTVEQVVGIEEVRVAQENVLKFESVFVKAQGDRRSKQHELTELQSKLKSVQHELNKLPRGDDRYLDLITDEHGLLRQESTIRNDLDLLEQAERGAFSQLSTALRYSHERERVYGERTKYFSVVGSVVGAMIGAIATGLSGYLRVRELHTAVDASADQCLQLKDMVGRLQTEVSQSSEKNAKFLDEFGRLVGINSAAILLAGVGEDQPRNRAATPSKQSAEHILPQAISNSPELLEFIEHTHTKLDSIESTVSRLSPVAEEGGNLVVRCDYPHPDLLSSSSIVEEVDNSISSNLRKYTVTVGSLAFVSGIAVTLSLLFSMR